MNDRCGLPVESLTGVPCCSPAERDPARALAWSEARVDERSGKDDETSRSGISIALWLPKGTTVALGLSQSPEREADVEAVRRDGVGMVRRQSGGGAVLLYPGVLCWEAWADCAELERVCEGGSGIRSAYAVLSGPVTSGLARLGVDAFHAGVCDVSVRIPGEERARKLAGTAQLRRKERVLVHGSLLVTADVAALSRYLTFPSEQPDYREGRGHADFCTTVAGVTATDMEPQLFMREVAGAIASAALIYGWRVLTPPESLDAAAEAHYADKYASPDWNWNKIRPRSLSRRET